MPVYNYTTLDDAFQVGFTTGAMGINDAGQIVGGYTNAGGGHGFLYSGGTYTPIDDPLATKGTGAAGINSVGGQKGFGELSRRIGLHSPDSIENKVHD